jgi:hypothetical protein
MSNMKNSKSILVIALNALTASVVYFSGVAAFISSGQMTFPKKRIIIPSPSTSAARETYNDDRYITSSLLYFGPETYSENTSDVFTSPVLKQVAPELLKWKDKHGHPNIPLKNPGGNQCQTLRRLHIQNKLTPTEVAWLEELGFTLHSMEDVYRYADFDDMFQRMMAYEGSHPDSNFQIPKKCPEDPELGAWVTGIRRLGKDGVNPDHERRLDEVGFTWISTRQCGSKFMIRYRELAQLINEQGLEVVLNDPKTVTWIQAQQEALKRGGLSQTRVHYMGNMFGDQWTMIGNPRH